MTISEQLAFSILSAPVAAADRRVLSQAWYSALYRASSKGTPSAQAIRLSAGARGPASRVCERPFSPAARQRSCAPRCLPHAASLQRAEFERRAPRLELARKIGELAAQRTGKRAAATFVLDGSRARVRILVTAGAGKVRLIAICAKKLEATVAAALAQARYTAAVAGVTLSTQTREDARC